MGTRSLLNYEPTGASTFRMVDYNAEWLYISHQTIKKSMKKISGEIENRILILYAILSLKKDTTKENVLNFLKNNDLIVLAQNDIEILNSRNEERWRNNLAYTRSHLIKDEYLSKNAQRGFWEITERGKNYYNNELLKIDRKLLRRVKHPNILKKFD